MADNPFIQAGATPVTEDQNPFVAAGATPVKSSPAKPDQNPFVAAGATPVTESQDDSSPDSIRQKMASDESYTPTDDEWRKLWTENQAKSSSQKFGEFLSGVGRGVKGIASLPKEAWQESEAEAAKGKPGEFVAREAAAIPEAAAGIVRMVTDPVLGTVSDLVKEIKAGQILAKPGETDADRAEQEFQAWKESQAFNLAKSRIPASADWVRGGVEPFKAVSNIASLALPVGEIGGLKYLKGAEPANAGKTLVQTAIEQGGKPAAQTVGEKVVGATGETAEKVGSGLKQVGKIPVTAAEAVAGKIVGPDAAAKAVRVAEGAGLFHPLTAPIAKATLAAEGTGEVLEKAGQAAAELAKTPAAGPFGRLVNMAKNSDAPEWLRQTAAIPGVRALYKAGQGAATVAKGAAAGAAIGGTLSALNDEPVGEGVGGGAALGAGFGAANARTVAKTKILRQRAAGVVQLVGDNLKAGVKPEILAKVPDAAMLAASDISYLGIKDAQGRDLTVRFSDEATTPDLKGQDGFYDTNAHQITMNADRLHSSPAAWSSIFHEVLHPLMESEVANRPELKGQVDAALEKSGKTLDQGKYGYAWKHLQPRLKAEGVKDPLAVDAWIKDWISKRDADSADRYKDPNHWFYSEILADAGRDALSKPKAVMSPEGAINKAITPTVSGVLQSALEKMGVEFKQPKALGRTVIPGFDNVVADPSLRKSVFNLLKAQRNFVPGISKGAEQGVKLTQADMGTDKAPFHALPNGTKGNKYAEVVPDGKGGEKVVMRNPSQVARAERAEAKALKKYIQPGQRVAKLPPEFYADPDIGEWTKKAAMAAEKSAADGTALEAWYHGLNKTGEADWKKSVKSTLGNVMASRQKFFVMPGGLHVSKAGNPLMDVFSIAGFDRKAQLWMNRKTGPLSLERWGGDIEKFLADVNVYNQNHAKGLPGESNNIGVEKRNLINAFLFGRNAKFAESNPLRKLLRGPEDRQGVVRSLRLDRLETLEPGETDLTRPNYDMGVKNFSPGADAPARLQELSQKETRTPAEDEELKALQARSTTNNSKEAFDQLAKATMDQAGQDRQFSPAATKVIDNKTNDVNNRSVKPLPNAVGDEKIPVIHLSSQADLKKVDPKFFGRGRANRNDRSGAPKAYFFVKGSPLEQDVNVFGKGGYYAHTGEVSGNKIYDLRMGKPDALGYYSTINREEADDMLRDAGYEGALVETGDGRQIVMMFKPVPVKAAGEFKGNKAKVGTARRQYSPEAEITQGKKEPNEDVRKVAEGYTKAAGLPYTAHTGNQAVREPLAKQIADFYDKAEHTPDDPAVKAAYDAFAKETLAQWNYVTSQGVTMEPWTKESQPYKNSADMMKDVRENKHLWFFPTEGGFGSTAGPAEHPLLEKSGIKVDGRDLPINDLFRAVHDYFGHAKEGYEFGPRGEYNAFLSHVRMYSDAAKPAMAAETLGQNSWVNFGPHLRNAEGNIPKKGEEGFVPLADRRFAEQKATVLPAEMVDQATSAGKQYSPEAEKKLAGMKGIKADEIPDKSGYFWMTREGTFIPIRDHSQLATEVGFNNIYDLYDRGLYRVVARVDDNGNKEVWLNSLEGAPALTPKQTQAVDVLQAKEWRVDSGDWTATMLKGKAFSPAAPIGSEEFKNWFGKSKATDETGNPKGFYHGTPNEFSEFDPKAPSPRLQGKSRGAIYFHPDEAWAKQYGKRVVPAYLQAQNPFDYENPTHQKLLLSALRKAKGFESWMRAEAKAGDWEMLEKPAVQKMLKAEGFDSYFVNDHPGKALAVFNPDQIRVADNTQGNAAEKIKAAAIKLPNGIIYSGKTHREAITAAEDAGAKPEDTDAAETGFVSDAGKFFNRIAASRVAVDAGQLPKDWAGHELDASVLKQLKFSPATEAPQIDDKAAARYAKRIASLTQSTGGTTFNVADGQSVSKGKVFGVSIYPDRSVVLTPNQVTPERVQQFIKDNSDLLSNSENTVGTWLDKSTGKVYLDVSVDFKDRALAEFAGKQYNQKAIWDSENEKEIYTGGTGEAIPDMPPATERLQKLSDAYNDQQFSDTQPLTLDADSLRLYSPAHEIDLSQLAGKKAFTIAVDRMGVGPVDFKGEKLSGIRQGGPGFSYLGHGVWGFSTEGAAKSFLRRAQALGTDIVGTAVLSEQNHMHTPFAWAAWSEALQRLVDAGAVSQKLADRHVRAIVRRVLDSQNKDGISDSDRTILKQIKSPGDLGTVSKKMELSWNANLWLKEKADGRTLPIRDTDELGISSTAFARALIDPRFIGLPVGSVVGFFQIDPSKGIHFDKDAHSNYSYIVDGKPIGILKTPVGIKNLTSDKRILNRKGDPTGQQMQTVMPALDRLERGQIKSVPPLQPAAYVFPPQSSPGPEVLPGRAYRAPLPYTNHPPGR